ncbi:MAG: radical SAM protein [Planctomycetes bacterium]|nr:radical SAM protein [Planctomycetota bacterium]
MTGASNARAAPPGCVVRAGRWTVHLCTPDEALHWVVDVEGRLLAGHVDGLHHRVGLDATVVARTPGLRGAARRLPPAEGDAVLAAAAGALRVVAEDLARGAVPLQLDHEAPPDAERARVADLLRRAADRAARPEDERAAFARVYRPVRVLPPDCAQALVAQLTEGCSYGRCSFCTLYAGVPFRIKPPAAFAAHLEDVAALLGQGAALRARLFLGDANALLAPMPSLLQALGALRARFPEAARGGVDAFVDVFSGRGRTADELRALRDAGLRRLTVGLESGHPPLLAWLRKPVVPEAVMGLVDRARRAGLDVGVTVLVGAGGREFDRAHVEDTAQVVRDMRLGPRDLVLLSPLVVDAASEYARRAARAGVRALAPDEQEAQADRLRAALSGGRWRVSRYDLERFVY